MKSDHVHPPTCQLLWIFWRPFLSFAGSAFSVEASNLRPPFLSISNFSLQVAICMAQHGEIRLLFWGACLISGQSKPKRSVAPDPFGLKQDMASPNQQRRWDPDQHEEWAAKRGWQFHGQLGWCHTLLAGSVEPKGPTVSLSSTFNSMANGTLTIFTSSNYADYACYQIDHPWEIAAARLL
jgi:hypothetical protein